MAQSPSSDAPICLARALHVKAEAVTTTPLAFRALDPVIQQHVEQFERLKSRFQDAMVKDRRYKLKSYKQVGSQLAFQATQPFTVPYPRSSRAQTWSRF